MIWPACIYIHSSIDPALANQVQRLHDQIYSTLDGKLDGFNIDESLVFGAASGGGSGAGGGGAGGGAPSPGGASGGGLAWKKQTKTSPKQLYVPFLDAAAAAYVRKKGVANATEATKQGLELVVDASSADYGQVCILDKDFLTKQLLTLKPEDPASVAAPGATIRTTYGTMIFEGFAGDEIVFNESGADVNFRVESDGNADAVHVDAGNNRVGILKVPGVAFDVAGKIRTDDQLESTIITGTAPLVVASTTKVANLNADLLDDLSSAAFQSADAELTALAGLTSAADKLPYFTGSGTAAVADFSAFARTLVDDADAATARATLGAGTSTLSGLTTSYLPRAASASTLANSDIFDDGTDILIGDNRASVTIHTTSGSILLNQGTEVNVELDASGVQLSKGWRPSVNREALSAAKTLVLADATVQSLDPGAAGRDVNLPTVAADETAQFTIVNRSTTQILTIKNAGGSTITTVDTAASSTVATAVTVAYDGTAWQVIGRT